MSDSKLAAHDSDDSDDEPAPVRLLTVLDFRVMLTFIWCLQPPLSTLPEADSDEEKGGRGSGSKVKFADKPAAPGPASPAPCMLLPDLTFQWSFSARDRVVGSTCVLLASCQLRARRAMPRALRRLPEKPTPPVRQKRRDSSAGLRIPW